MRLRSFSMEGDELQRTCTRPKQTEALRATDTRIVVEIGVIAQMMLTATGASLTSSMKNTEKKLTCATGRRRRCTRWFAWCAHGVSITSQWCTTNAQLLESRNSEVFWWQRKSGQAAVRWSASFSPSCQMQDPKRCLQWQSKQESTASS